MDYLPIFADLKQRPVLVVGGGEVAARKVDLLLRAGAEIRIVAQSLSPILEELHQQGRIRWQGQAFAAQQLDEVFLVIAATDDSALNAEVFAEADKRRVLANVVDDQPRCSFIFPSIIDRSPLVVAVSSSGQAPVLARMLREKLEALLPASLGQMAEVAGRWRGQVKQRLNAIGERRRFWKKHSADVLPRWWPMASPHRPSGSWSRIYSSLPRAAKAPRAKLRWWAQGRATWGY